jgi:hypothetical protein
MQSLETQKRIIIDAVNRVFQGFTIVKDFNSETYTIIDVASGNICMKFEFTDHAFIKKHYGDLPHDPKYKNLTVLHIVVLSKCGANRGNALLALADRLAESIPFVEYTALTDSSNITKCNIPVALPKLKILTSETGESWYGRWGYKSPTTHSNDMAHNNQIRNQNMRDFLKRVHPSVMSYAIDAFPDLNVDVTVHEYIKQISEQIDSFPEKTGCSELQQQKIEALLMLIHALNVGYTHKLIKPNIISRGGNKRTRVEVKINQEQR